MNSALHTHAWGLLSVLVAAACGPNAKVSNEDAGQVADAGYVADADTGGTDAGSHCPPTQQLVPSATVTIEGVGNCDIVLEPSEPVVAEISVPRANALFLDEEPDDEPGWLKPRQLQGSHTLRVVGGRWSATIETFAPPVGEVRRERSLVWTTPELLDDDELVGLDRLMTLAGGNPKAGPLFAWLLRRFATTAHSERLGPQQLLEEIEATHGSDPLAWDLDDLDFTVTGVHNRLDLTSDASCGELRVSVASSHPIYQPFHLIFLFGQPPGPGDLSPAGTLHCTATARRWAELSALDDGAFIDAATELLRDGLTPANFLMIESVEFIVSPWEWRQWRPISNPDSESELTTIFENPPMFQTVDVALPDSRRGSFLEFVTENADALNARQLLIPEWFLSPSARVNAGVPWVPLDLTGLDASLTGQFPDLRQNLEIVGCPACHATDADFIHTRPDRTFSPFYDKELDARAVYLDGAQRGTRPAARFGPLQETPVLPP